MPLIKTRHQTVAFVNFNEKEESTVIISLEMLKFDCVKAYLLVPILSLLSLMILPLRLYWSDELKSEWLYSKTTSLE